MAVKTWAGHCADSARLLRTPDDALGAALADWLHALSTGALPAPLCCSRGGQIAPEDWSVSVLETRRSGDEIAARVGLFFTEIVGGCNCHDEPPRFSDYCELRLEISGESTDIRWRSAGPLT